ncbi:hypothetical protein [Streptomyces lavendulae]|uniref:hypothetical protein n=1 Tax=Streptomyces lavendulae TaxID=1914 RepID=UPI0036E7FAD9
MSAEVWGRVRRDLPGPAAAAVRAVDVVLAGGDARAAVAAARSVFAAYAVAVPLPVAVALRRPFHRLPDELDALSRPAA